MQTGKAYVRKGCGDGKGRSGETKHLPWVDKGTDFQEGLGGDGDNVDMVKQEFVKQGLKRANNKGLGTGNWAVVCGQHQGD